MTGGEMAYMALVLTAAVTFMVVVFALSNGFRDTTTQARPAPQPGELPKGSAKAAA